MEKGKLVFAGGGVIGAGLAVNAILSGFPVAVYDTCAPTVTRGSVEQILDTFVENDAYTRQEADAAGALATYTQDLEEALKGAIFVQESIIERLDIKQTFYRQVQEIAGDKVVIGSSASNILTTDLQEGALYPDKIVVGHPFNPSYLLPVVEIVAGKQTSQETVGFAKAVYESIEKVPIVCLKERIGYVVQGLNAQLLLSAQQLVVEGVASAEDIDKALMFGPGMRLPIAGQLLSIALGVKGGWRAKAKKYQGQEPAKEDILIADSLDQEMANRPSELGNTPEEIIQYRDKALIGMLRLQHRL